MKREPIPWGPSAAGAGVGRVDGRALAALAAVIAAMLWLLALHSRTALEMASTWSRSVTYSHGFVVPPLALWLVWRQRETLRAIAPAPAFVWLLPIGAAGAAWLLGDLVQVNALTALALVTMIVLAVPLVAGTRMARAIAFPLGFLYFSVPIGDFLLPQLMQWTADFTVWALQASGVPVYREGLQFVIPSGRWSVVEACSGVRYLIASLTVGSLYAYLSYRSTLRRLAFVAVAIVVPIVANWVRAYGIVMLGHLSSNRLAVGVDHLIYGWVFFGIVVLAMFAIGARWREDGPEHEPPPVLNAPVQVPAPRTGPWAARLASPWAAVAALALVSGLWPLADAAIDAREASRGAVQLAPLADVPGWTRLDDGQGWQPQYRNAPAARLTQYRRGDDVVGLYLAYYRDQSNDSKLVTSENALVRLDDPHSVRLSAGSRRVTMGGTGVDVREERLRVDGAREIVALQWYVVDGHATASDLRTKVYTAASRLRGAGDDGAAVVVYTDARSAGALDAFVTSAAPALADALSRTAGGR